MRSGGNGWSSPSVILTIFSLIMTAIAGYIALQKDDDREHRDLDRRLYRLETIIERERRH